VVLDHCGLQHIVCWPVGDSAPESVDDGVHMGFVFDAVMPTGGE
jgi:hypothetical protein